MLLYNTTFFTFFSLSCVRCVMYQTMGVIIESLRE